MLNWDSEAWKQLTDEDFSLTFNHSAIKRAGFVKLKQNIEVLKSKE